MASSMKKKETKTMAKIHMSKSRAVEVDRKNRQDSIARVKRSFDRTAERLKRQGINDLIDLAREDGRRRDVRQDAASVMNFVVAELESVKAKMFEDVYPELKARMLIPGPPGEADPGAEFTTYYRMGLSGQAKLVRDYANDISFADIDGSKHQRPCHRYASGFMINKDELLAAGMTGRSFRTDKASAAVRTVERQIDAVAAIGDTETGVTGALNDANVGLANALYGSWLTATADEMVNTINEAVIAIGTQSKMAHTGNTVILPTLEFMTAASKKLQNSSETVLSHLLKTSPFITDIDGWWRCDGAGAAGANRMWVYQRDADVLYLDIPDDVSSEPEQYENFALKVPISAKIGGTVIPRPLAMEYRDFT